MIRYAMALVYAAMVFLGCAPALTPRDVCLNDCAMVEHNDERSACRVRCPIGSVHEYTVGVEYAGLFTPARPTKNNCASMIALRIAWKPPIHNGGYSLEVFRGSGTSSHDAKNDAWTEWFGWKGSPRQTAKIEVVTRGVDAEDDDNPGMVTRCWSSDVPADVRAWPSNGSYAMASYAQWAGMSWEQNEKNGEVDAQNPNCLVWEVGEVLTSNYTRYNGWAWRPAAKNSSVQSCRYELQGREQIQTSDGWELGSSLVMAMAKDNMCGPVTYAQSNAERSLLARIPAGFQQKQFVGACWKTGTTKPDQPSDWSGKDGAW